MIKSFSHKGLKVFFETGDSKAIHPHHVEKVRLILSLLDAAETVSSLNISGFRLHRLHGGYKGFWAVSINGKWRIIFKFTDKHAFDVDYLDYH